VFPTHIFPSRGGVVRWHGGLTFLLQVRFAEF